MEYVPTQNGGDKAAISDNLPMHQSPIAVLYPFHDLLKETPRTAGGIAQARRRGIFIVSNEGSSFMIKVEFVNMAIARSHDEPLIVGCYGMTKGLQVDEIYRTRQAVLRITGREREGENPTKFAA
jgi:hypothetical protein